MNSYSLGISGSWLLVVLTILCALGLALYSYYTTIPPISTGKKSFLITLRTLALSLLIIALFEPILSLVRSSIDEPQLAVLLDNSQSMTIRDIKGNRLEGFKNALTSSNVLSLNDAAHVAKFQDNVLSINHAAIDSLKFDGQLTDISSAIRWIGERADNVNLQAGLLITDGAFNTGANPLYEAEMLGKPLYIIGIGDSSEPKDIAVQTIITNEITYLDASVPVNVNIKSAGITDEKDSETKLILSDNGIMVAEQTIRLRSEQNIYSALFDYHPKIEGIHKLIASIAPKNGELTPKNNSLSEFINVLKQKRKVVLFAGAPSSDVSFIRSILDKEKGAEVTAFIQKQGAEFYESQPNSQSMKDAETIVLIGFPNSSTPVSVMQMIAQECERGKPLLFVASLQTDYTKLRILEPYLPFAIVSSRPQEFLAFADVPQRALSNSLLKITGTNDDARLWNQLPPIYRTETFVKMKPESEVLSTIKVNTTPLSEPLISSREFQGKKSVAILGYGLYRWKLLGEAAEVSKGRQDMPDILSIFLQNTTKWLTATDNQKSVRIRTSKKLYSSGEKVECIAQVYDQTLAPIENADVIVKISGGKSPREVHLTPISNGRYTGQIDGLSEGDYAFSGSVTVNQKPYGSDNGRFSVGDIALEYQNVRMNSELLRQIAERTGGKFYTPETASALLNDLKKQPTFKERTITQKSEFALWNLPWMLASALLFFAVEWFVRKRSGMV
ncbi:MAG: VWA domain-containing protein [Ignavibacteria bacterium]|nr:VWA domain-containing protein [Ignavibacteria bacterium]